jgi:hypothetical protein
VFAAVLAVCWAAFHGFENRGGRRPRTGPAGSRAVRVGRLPETSELQEARRA